MSIKKLIGLLLVLVLVFLAACAAPAADPQEPEAPTAETDDAPGAETPAEEPAAPADDGDVSVIQYWYPWGGDSEEWDLWRIAEFERDNPGFRVESTFVPPDGGIEGGRLIAAIAGGTPPDLVVTGETANGYALRYMDALLDMESYLAAEGVTIDVFTPAVRDIMSDGWYVIPMDSNVIMLFWSKTLFEEAGLDPDTPPTTIAELDEFARRLDKFDGDEITTMGFVPWVDSGDDPFVWSWVFGSEVSNMAQNTINITDQGMINYMEWNREYAQRYDPTRVRAFTAGFGELFSHDHPFMTGSVAMTTIGNWMFNVLRIYAPDLDFGVTVLPHPDGGRSVASPLYTNIYLVPAGAANPEGSAKFMAYAWADHIIRDNIETWFTVPVIEAAFDDLDFVRDNDWRFAVVQQLANSTNSAHVGICSVSGELRDFLRIVRDQVIYDDADPLPLLEALQERLEGEIARQG